MKTPRSNIEETLDLFRTHYPDIPINEQPKTSLGILLKFEKTYGMNTSEAINKRIALDEAVHHQEEYAYLVQWESAYHTFLIHKGDVSKLNKL